MKRVVRAIVLPTHDQSQVRHREKDLARAIALLFQKQGADRRNLGSRSRLKELGQVQIKDDSSLKGRAEGEGNSCSGREERSGSEG